jgi:hypothetical protein
MKSVEAKFNSNYKPGYIGFSYRDDNILSRGISFFTKVEADDIVVTHSFVVYDDLIVLEAGLHGVVLTRLKPKLDDPATKVFFKKPTGWTPDIGQAIAANALSHVGQPYAISLFPAFVVRWIYRYLYKSPPPFLKRPAIFDDPDSWVCSELVADAMYSVSNYNKLPPLSEIHISRISPIDLFNSDQLFTPWRFDDE